MHRKWINAVALMVIALGASAAHVGGNGLRQAVNKCQGGGQVCYCSGACSADSNGCHCI
jgi:hypothetical protein